MEAKYETLIERYFWFLVNEFGLKYSECKFISDKLEIEVSFDRDSPTIEIRPLSEPAFTKLQIDWIIDYFTDSEFSKTFSPKFGELEENTSALASILRLYSKRLLFEIDDWWVPAHRYRLGQWESLSIERPIEAFSKIYKYLETKT